jgi:hypothetical protein
MSFTRDLKSWQKSYFFMGNARDRTIRTEPTCVSWILLTIRTYMTRNSQSPWLQSRLLMGLNLKWRYIRPCPHTLPTMCALYTLDFKSRFDYKNFFYARPSFLLLLPLVFTFLPPLSFPLLHDVKRTNERANERLNGNSPLLTSRSSFLTITNFLPLASFLFLLTLDRLQRWRR